MKVRRARVKEAQILHFPVTPAMLQRLWNVRAIQVNRELGIIPWPVEKT